MALKNGISVVMILYNDGEEAVQTFESVKDIADEIIVIHDGKPKPGNKTLEIAKRYTDKIFVRPWQGMCEYHQAFGYRKAKYKWIIKLDADEYLSKPLQKNIRNLIKAEDVDMYTFLCPYWDPSKNKYITKSWPRKGNFYRRDKIHYLGFTNWGQPKVDGKIVDTPYLLEHKPKRGLATSWDIFWKRSINNSALFQCKDSLRKFSWFDRFQYPNKDFPIQVRIRRDYPLLSAIPIALYSMFLDTKDIGWKESPLLRLKLMFFNASKYIFMGYHLFRLKRNPKYHGLVKK